MITKEIVEQVLEEYPKTRDNDFLLTMHVYIKLGHAKRMPLGVMIYYKNLEFAPAWETITRLRREIQNNEQRLQPSEEVQERRHKRQIEFHTKYSSKSKAYTMPNSWMSPE